MAIVQRQRKIAEIKRGQERWKKKRNLQGKAGSSHAENVSANRAENDNDSMDVLKAEKPSFTEAEEDIQKKAEKTPSDEPDEEIAVNSEAEPEKESRKYLSKAERLFKGEKNLLAYKADAAYIGSLQYMQKTSEYAILYNRVLREIKEVKLLGEIEISDAEYRVLRNHFQKIYLKMRRESMQIPIDFMFALTLVQIAVREYDGNGYWNLVAHELGLKRGIPQYQRDWIGGCLKKVLKIFGKPFYIGTEYVANIMLHCFVTDRNAGKFYDYLFKYYNLDLERNLDGDALEESDFICNAMINHDSKRQQYLSNYSASSIYGDHEYCRDLIAKILVSMDHDFWGETAETLLTGRFLKTFDNWKHNSDFFIKEREHRRAGEKHEVHFHSPRLICDLGSAEFSLLMPPQLVLADERENPEIYWRIWKSRIIDAEMIEGVSGYKICQSSCKVTPDLIFNKTVIELVRDGKVLRSFAISEKNVRFFDETGAMIEAESLGEGMYYAFSKSDTVIRGAGVLSQRYRSGLKFYELHLSLGDMIEVSGAGTNSYYYIGPMPKTGLLTQFKAENACGIADVQRIDIYSKLPGAVFDIEDAKAEGTAIVVNGKKMKFSRQNFVKVERRGSEKKYYYLDTASLENMREGLNHILVDFPGQRQIILNFVYIRNFKFGFEDAPYLYKERGTLSKGYRRKKRGCFYGHRIRKDGEFSDPGTAGSCY